MVETVITSRCRSRSAGSDYSTQLTGYDPGTVMHGFIDSAGNPVALPTEGVLVDQAITAVLPDLRPGTRWPSRSGPGPPP